MSGHIPGFCVGLYSSARKRAKGCPVMIAHKVSDDYMIVEASDGSIKLEPVSSCCLWGAKFEGVMAWRNKFLPEDKET